MTKISSKSIVAASANQKIPVSPDNAISPHTIKIYADAAVDLTTVEAVALGASADDGTLYRITGTGGSPLPTGIDNILIWGASSTAGGFDYGNARALVTALGVYVPCTYDVATNEIFAQVTAEILFTGFAGSGSYEVLKNDLGVTFGSLSFDGGSNYWAISVSADFAKNGDAKYVDINVGTSRNQIFTSVTPFAYYDAGGTKIFISSVDSLGAYSDDLWAGVPLKITITSQL